MDPSTAMQIIAAKYAYKSRLTAASHAKTIECMKPLCQFSGLIAVVGAAVHKLFPKTVIFGPIAACAGAVAVMSTKDEIQYRSAAEAYDNNASKLQQFGQDVDEQTRAVQFATLAALLKERELLASKVSSLDFSFERIWPTIPTKFPDLATSSNHQEIHDELAALKSTHYDIASYYYERLHVSLVVAIGAATGTGFGLWKYLRGKNKSMLVSGVTGFVLPLVLVVADNLVTTLQKNHLTIASRAEREWTELDLVQVKALEVDPKAERITVAAAKYTLRDIQASASSTWPESMLITDITRWLDARRCAAKARRATQSGTPLVQSRSPSMLCRLCDVFQSR
eukprot:TRINITY_DN5521_c0_g2_i1.p1 TRINITY_DN5521_c0_g2~~TRINITY_DN5521_c0_g2_i1.p1  ORF type:complete len:350 (+),score=32.51 TRINITY_DN5521_c0_g2_i1:36-1052(+)